jgi:2'-5' RNA ligase
MRLFFAVLPPVEIRDRIAAAARRLPMAAGSALVPPENYHVTLAFVGEVPAGELDALREIGASQRAKRFTVRLDATEYWPEAAVLVAVAREIPASLASLCEQLRENLAIRGLARNPPPLRPHVTIARKVPQAPVLQAMSALGWEARTFNLLQSTLNAARPGREVHPVYTVLDTWPLLDE